MSYQPVRFSYPSNANTQRSSALNRACAVGLFLGFLLFACTVGGCDGLSWKTENGKKADLGVTVCESPLGGSAAVRDTIGANAYYDGLAPQRVSGFGLVVGLGRNGSRDCPRDIYSRLVQELYKRQRSAVGVVGVKRATPEDLIDSMDTAVVVVRADIPPVAAIGKTFEVSVLALPGTQTKSLRGGRLLPTDLSRIHTVSAQRTIAGKVLGRAAGPLLLNPFTEGSTSRNSGLAGRLTGAVARGTELRGTIVGGGVVVNERLTRLVLTTPSYPLVRRIRDRINDQFPGPQRVADATSPSFIELRCPKAFHGDEAHFLGLVRSLCITRNQQFDAQRARALGEELLNAAAPHAAIALCFEGLGAAALPVVRGLYAHAKPYVAFHAAAAGLRLEDHLAGDVMAMIAARPNDEFRFRAIRALADAKGMANTLYALRRLLGDEDPRVRVAAYEALIKRHDGTIESYRLGNDNFVLDLIPGSDRNLVYVRRTGQRRIALFGDNLRCSTPVFYRAVDGSLTITAQPGDDRLTILRTVVATGNVSPSIAASPQLSELVQLMGRRAGVDLKENVTGLGLDYGAVTHAIYRLCKDKSINANFMMEQPNVAELFGPSPEAGRPESEL